MYGAQPYGGGQQPYGAACGGVYPGMCPAAAASPYDGSAAAMAGACAAPAQYLPGAGQPAAGHFGSPMTITSQQSATAVPGGYQQMMPVMSGLSSQPGGMPGAMPQQGMQQQAMYPHQQQQGMPPHQGMAMHGMQHYPGGMAGGMAQQPGMMGMQNCTPGACGACGACHTACGAAPPVMPPAPPMGYMGQPGMPHGGGAVGSKYAVGDAVLVFSQSQNNWIPAEIKTVKEDGAVIVQYGNNAKEVPLEYQESHMRRAGPGPGMPPPGGMHSPAGMHQPGEPGGPGAMGYGGGPPPPGGGGYGPPPGPPGGGYGGHMAYQVGHPVEVFSKGTGGWVPAHVIEAKPDGSIIVRYDGTNKAKEIPPHEQHQMVRDAASSPVGMASIGSAASMHAGGYQVGQKLQCWSKANDSWVPAHVLEVHEDGTIVVQYSGTTKAKQVSLHEQAQMLRPAMDGYDHQSPVRSLDR